MRWLKQRIFPSFFDLLILSIPLFSLATDTFTGKVVGVSDGDTISVMREGRAMKVRIAGIDCPERGQPFGKRAKQCTSDMAFNNEVEVRIKTTDRKIIRDVVTYVAKLLNDVVGIQYLR